MSAVLMPDHHSAPVREGVDPSPFMAEALEEIFEAVFETGQWPANREGFQRPMAVISLAEFLADQPDAPSIVCGLIGYGLGRDNDREQYVGAVEALQERFRSEYATSAEVQDRAAELAREARDAGGFRE